MPLLSYTISDIASEFAPHDSFTISTPFEDDTLCGVISYEGMFVDSVVDGDDIPLAYASDTRIFTAESNEQELIDKSYKYSVVATLAEYPTSATATAEGEI
jgi:hypothetical protein